MPSLEVMEATVSGLASRAALRLPLPALTLALYLLATVCVLALLRTAVLRFARASRLASSVPVREKDAHVDAEAASPRRWSTNMNMHMNWNWNWRWEGLPLSLTLAEKAHPAPAPGGVAAALRQYQRQQQPQTQMAQTAPVVWHARPRGPGFETPLPALYDTPVPVSAAKLIMARHTYRRPSPPKPKPKAPRSRSAPPPPRPLYPAV